MNNNQFDWIEFSKAMSASLKTRSKYATIKNDGNIDYTFSIFGLFSDSSKPPVQFENAFNRAEGFAKCLGIVYPKLAVTLGDRSHHITASYKPETEEESAVIENYVRDKGILFWHQGQDKAYYL